MLRMPNYDGSIWDASIVSPIDAAEFYFIPWVETQMCGPSIELSPPMMPVSAPPATTAPSPSAPTGW